MTEPSTSRIHRMLRAMRKEAHGALSGPDSYDAAEVASMLRAIGIALVEVEQPTQQVTARLLKIAARYTTDTVRTIVLPTVLVIQVGTVGYEVETSTHATVQLDLAGRIDAIAELAELGAITPSDAVKAVDAARAMNPRFGAVTSVIGYAITTVGFGMVINPTWASLPGYLFLGVVVGAIITIGRPFPWLNSVLPTLAATVVTMLATWFVADAANDGLLRVIAPALVAILPGMSLTIGAMEVASSQIIGGASRLVYGVVQLMLLVFGVAIGVHIAGRVAPQAPSPQMGPWALYAAIVVIGFGLYIYLSAPKGSLFWLTAAVAVALLGQQLGSTVLSSPYGGGVIGAFLAVPFAMVAARVRTSPPAIVMMLTAFWSLVPGALSFESLSEAATGGGADVGSLGETVAAIFSIALGTLVGWSVFNAFNSRAQRT
ncbi:threonine/serine ThrE exporter family protein [Mycolicibacterium komossense]|uniref:Threonine/serine exporter family protein n=1 Tax=Mycolicibacterium komossense TaxID=1779 RepID=A0ABT3C977_9MYCO|nr:threonine/serine exporter family protein [Mycolicibacterium komossense]MCV7226024.1 threonine/serine exporter family protein [Mycolicibacterium komossense]